MPDTFGVTRTGATVLRHRIAAGDLGVSLITHGATVQDVRLDGIAHSLTLGSPHLAAYEGKMASCGAIMGPVANRIAGSAATIDGTSHRLSGPGSGDILLHGGTAATHRRVWDLLYADETSVTLALTLPDGESGFPGNRKLTAQFQAEAPATLRLTLTADTDAPTLVNLANHSYWRLDDRPTVAGHLLQIDSDSYLPTTDDLIPTSQIAPVAGTRFDYREGRALQAGAEGLIDTNFCLSDGRRPLRPVATLTGQSGVRMEMATTEPGLQVFDGHTLDLPQFVTHDGTPPRPYAAVALEAQFWPDAPNHPAFPSILLQPGDAWRQVTEWRFHKP